MLCWIRHTLVLNYCAVFILYITPVLSWPKLPWCNGSTLVPWHLLHTHLGFVCRLFSEMTKLTSFYLTFLFLPSYVMKTWVQPQYPYLNLLHTCCGYIPFNYKMFCCGLDNLCSLYIKHVWCTSHISCASSLSQPRSIARVQNKKRNNNNLCQCFLFFLAHLNVIKLKRWIGEHDLQSSVCAVCAGLI